MKILSNPHTHSLYCDGKSTIAEMADSARSLGFVSLGFSGHGHQNFDVRFSMFGENTVRYLAELRALKAECAGRMRIYAGVERDYYAELNPADYDYSIGSVPVSYTHLGDFDTELAKEFFLAFCRTLNATLHIRQLDGENSHHIIEAMFKAFGRAMSQACLLYTSRCV